MAKNLLRYERQEALMGERNSMNKTDLDASFMRMKDDHMQNGQLKPGYNFQISTKKQVIANYTLAQTTADTTTFIDRLEEHIASFNEKPNTLTIDAGYGSEENYTTLESHGIETFVEYNYFHKELLDKKRGKFHPYNLYYNVQTDTYYCPMGQPMKNIGLHHKKTKTGFVQTITSYQAFRCTWYPHKAQCHRAKTNRIIQRNHNLQRLKQQAKEKLLSEKGIAHRKKTLLEC